MKNFLSIIFISLLSLVTVAQDWTEPVVIYGEGVNANPCLTIDKSGTIHCVWSHEIETDFHKLYYSKSEDDGLTWSMPMDIAQNDSLRLDEPQIIVDTNDFLYVSYSYDVVSIPSTMIYLQVFDGVSWGVPTVVSEGYLGSWGSRLVLDHENKLFCFWYHPSNGGTIYYRYYQDSVWSSINQPFPGSNDYFYLQMATVDDQNNLHCVAYHHYEGQTIYNDRVIYFTYENDIWSTFSEVSTSRPYSRANIDLTNIDQPVIVWVQATGGTGFGKYGTYISSLVSGNWTPLQLIADSSLSSGFTIDLEDNYYIMDVENPDNFVYHLVFYEQNGQTWENTIIETTNTWIGINGLYLFDTSLYLLYLKVDGINGNRDPQNSIFFRRKDLITNNRTIDSNEALRIYPNPVSDQIILEFYLSNIIPLDVRIMDLYGNLIYSKILQYPCIGFNRYIIDIARLDINHFNNGIYFLLCYSSNNEISVVKKIIIN